MLPELLTTQIGEILYLSSSMKQIFHFYIWAMPICKSSNGPGAEVKLFKGFLQKRRLVLWGDGVQKEVDFFFLPRNAEKDLNVLCFLSCLCLLKCLHIISPCTITTKLISLSKEEEIGGVTYLIGIKILKFQQLGLGLNPQPCIF